jgi:hypothetical protein
MKRVNIQYSIELEDLPDEIDRIYANAKNLFKEIKLPNAKEKNILSSHVLRELDETRRKLTRLDLILSDVTGIVGSYVEYEVSEHNKKSEAPSEVNESGEDSSQMPT